MNRVVTLVFPLILFICAGAGVSAAEVRGAQASTIPAWFKASFLDLREDVAEAAKANKRLMIYFHQEGCPYCARLVNTNFSQREIVDYLRTHFDAIDLDLWGDREVTDMNGKTWTEKEYAKSIKVWFTPTLLFLNEHGKVVLRINGYYPPNQFLAALHYVGEHREKALSFHDYLAEHAPPPAAGALHDEPFFSKPPHNLSKVAGEKPVAVFFEQRDCPACDTLHREVLNRKASRAQLARFHSVQLDMWSDTPVVTPRGQHTTAARWARELNVVYAPTAVLFDQGTEVVRAEAFLKAFHFQSVLDYAASGAYKTEASLQRFISARAARLVEQGQTVDIWD